MRKKKLKKTPFYNAIINSFNLLIDLTAQIINLIIELIKESEHLKKSKNYITSEDNEKLEISPVTIRALKSSIVIFQFSLLESISNFLTELVLNINNGIKGAPKIVCPLKQFEIDFLSEIKTDINRRTGTLKTTITHVSTIDKLNIVSHLFGKLHGINFRLDKSGIGWRNIRKLKDIRDKLAHPKLDFSDIKFSNNLSKIINIDEVKPALIIKNNSLFNGAVGIRWYLQQIISLLAEIKKTEYTGLILQFIGLDVMCHLMIINLPESCSISYKSIENICPVPYKPKNFELKARIEIINNNIQTIRST